jgi:hypothetical protein
MHQYRRYGHSFGLPAITVENDKPLMLPLAAKLAMLGFLIAVTRVRHVATTNNKDTRRKMACTFDTERNLPPDEVSFPTARPVSSTAREKIN